MPKASRGTKYITVTQLCRISGASAPTIYRYCESGHLDYHQWKPHGHRKIKFNEKVAKFCDKTLKEIEEQLAKAN